MSFTYCGSGTTYYGCKDVGPDDSYVTTEWFVLWYVPLIPLRSYRVLPTKDSANLLVYQSQKYLVRKIPLDRRQVLNGYLVTSAIIAMIAFIWAFS